MKGRIVATIDVGWVGKYVHSQRGASGEASIPSLIMLPDRPPPREILAYIEDGVTFTLYEQCYIGFRGFDVA